MNPGTRSRVQAEQLKGGFAGGRIKTLQAGCEVDVHLADDTTAGV